MSTYAFIPGAGDGGWYWHLVEAELRSRGHRTVAPDLPTDESATLSDYADVVVEAVGEPEDLIVVGQSFGAFTAPLVADRLPTAGLVLVAGMVPRPGERPEDWWGNTGHSDAVREQAAAGRRPHGQRRPDGLLLPRRPGGARPWRTRPGARAALDDRLHPAVAAGPVAGRADEVRARAPRTGRSRPAFLRRVVLDRLGVVPEEIVSGHCPALGHPRELADLLHLGLERARPEVAVRS